MERTTFKEWMTRKEEPNRFFIIELNVSQNLWDTTYLPRVKEKFQVKQTVMIHNDRGWKENETSLRELSLFPENRLITLDGVSEDVAFCISRNRSFPPDYFFLYLPGDVLKKKWERGVIIQIEFRERDFWEWLNQKIAQEKVTFTPPARKKLYQFWLEYDIREEDLIECIQLSDRTRPIEGDDVELFFEQSEKTLLFRFLDTLSEKKVAQSIRYFLALLRKKHSTILLLSMVARRYRLILQCILSPGETKDLWKNTPLNNFELQKVRGYAKKYSLSDIQDIFRTLNHMDRLMKSTSSDFGMLMLDLISQIAVRVEPEQAPTPPGVFDSNGT